MKHRIACQFFAISARALRAISRFCGRAVYAATRKTANANLAIINTRHG